MIFDPTIEIDNNDAHDIIRNSIRNGNVTYSRHVKERMMERGYSLQDVEYIILFGVITKKQPHEKTHHWTYTIKGVDLDGDTGQVVASITKNKSSVIITVLG